MSEMIKAKINSIAWNVYFPGTNSGISGVILPTKSVRRLSAMDISWPGFNNAPTLLEPVVYQLLHFIFLNNQAIHL